MSQKKFGQPPRTPFDVAHAIAKGELKPQFSSRDLSRFYVCDHCGYESLVKAQSHQVRGCPQTNCNGRQSPVAEEG